MKRRNILTAIMGFFVGSSLSAQEPVIQKCLACGLIIPEGEVVAPVIRYRKPIAYIHFKCALIKHLRTLPKK